MDVANRIFKNIALFLVAALVVVAPAWAQSTLSATSGVAALSGNQAVQIGVTATPTDTTYTVQSTASFAAITSSNNFKTPDTLSFQIQNPNCLLFTNPCTGTATLHPTNRTDTAGDVNITVTYSSSGGGGGGGPIQANPPSLNLNAPAGQQASQQVALSSSQTVSFQPSSDQPWLSATNFSNFTIVPPNNVTFTVIANAFGYTAGTTLQGNVIISPNAGVQTKIPVTFVVGGGGSSGSFTVSQNSIAFSYPSGTTSTFVTVTSSATNFFNFTTSSSSNWLLFDNQTSGGNASTGISHSISVNAAAAQQLFNSGITNTSGFVTLTNPNNPSDAATINVSLTLGGGSQNGITLSQTSLSVSAPLNGAVQTTNITVTAPTTSPSVSTSVTPVNGTTTSFVSVSPSPFSTGTQTVGINVYPYFLSAAGTYYNNVTFQSGSNSATLQVTLTIGNGGGGGGGTSLVAPTSLTFALQAGTGTNNVSSQYVGVGASSYTVTQPSATWLSVSPGPGTGPAVQAVTVSLNSPANSLAAGSYTTSFSITPSGGTATTISVTLNVASTPVLNISPNGTVNLSFGAGGSPAQQTVFVYNTHFDLLNISASSQTSWITVSPTSSTGQEPSFTITANGTGLCNGLNTGSVIFTSTNAANSPVTVPVVLLVTGSTVTNCSGGGGGPLTLSTSSLNFTAPLNGTVPANQFVTVTSSSVLQFSVTSSTQIGGSWLTVFPTGINCCFASSSPTTLTVGVNQTNLPSGTYAGTITLTPSTGGSQTINVTMVVGTGSSLTVNPTSLTYNFTPGGTAPQAQQISVTSPSGSSPISFTYQATSESNFLQANTGGGNLANGTTLTTPVTLNATIDPTVLASLSAGVTHTGTITLTPVGGGTAVTIPVSLIIAQAASVTASPTTMSFAFTAGGATPSTQPITVSGTSGATFSATATSVGNWLSVSPTTGTVPATLNVSVNPAGLNANTYTGTIVVAGTGSSTGSTTINVTLTVSAPLPTITQIGSAASYVGTGVAPGEWIAIQGNGLGPATGLTLTIDQSTGKVSTTLGGVQVFVNGFAAPIVYASNTLVNAVVPYEVAGGPGTVAQILVKFLGVSSNAVGIPVVSTLPGIFTQNASGAGPGWVRNSDFSPNSSAFPAKKGEIVSVILTGEGLTTPTAVTGKVTTVSSTPPPTPVPLLPVAVLVDGKPASPTFVGEAPSILSGVLQVNFQVPTNASSGPVSLVVSVGGVASQPNVIMFVQ